MIGSIGQETPFDTPFFLLQLATMVLWLLAAATVRWQRRLGWVRTAAIALAVVSEIVLPVVWSVGFPAYGLAKLRVFIGVAGTLIETVLACFWAVLRAADAVQPRWPAARPFIGVTIASVVLWFVLD